VVTETENVMEIAERVATTAPTQHDSRPLTAAKTAGQCKTAFANRTGVLTPIRRGGLLLGAHKSSPKDHEKW
jgi:hypothetical protein